MEMPLGILVSLEQRENFELYLLLVCFPVMNHTAVLESECPSAVIKGLALYLGVFLLCSWTLTLQRLLRSVSSGHPNERSGWRML